jgi:hypothetical protein
MHVSIPIIFYKFPIGFPPPSTGQLCPLPYLFTVSLHGSYLGQGGEKRVNVSVKVICGIDIDKNSHAAGKAYFSNRNSFLT